MSSSVITLSVVIPTYNRVGPLERCLIALARQTYPDDAFEVVVVVDGSTDGTLEMLERINTPYPLHVCPQANQGAGVARNQGIEVATGTYCLFIDDDIMTDEDLIAEHVRVQEAYGGVVGVGHLE